MPRSKVKAQLGLQEEVIEDSDLEALLEELEGAKETVKQFHKNQKRLKVMLPKDRTQGKQIRCGRFLITGAVSEGGKEIAFETGPGYRLTVEVTED